MARYFRGADRRNWKCDDGDAQEGDIAQGSHRKFLRIADYSSAFPAVLDSPLPPI